MSMLTVFATLYITGKSLSPKCSEMEIGKTAISRPILYYSRRKSLLNLRELECKTV